MKLHFDNVNMSVRTGPNVFASRLARALIELGHDITDAKDANVSLVFIEPSGNKLAKRTIQRLDGIWFKPDEFQTHNVKMKQLYENADAVIWQSLFDSSMTKKWWGSPRNGTIILNGIEPKPCIDLTTNELISIRQKNALVFVCSANWHPQKRLRANIELFSNINRSVPDSCLIVLGNKPDVWVPNNQKILYAGSQPEEIYTQVYAMSDWMIHLAWLDHCPNVVVEALNQNTPIIHSSDGGTKELVLQYGLCIDESIPYNFELADYDNPPKINVDHVTQLPDVANTTHADISMKTCASAYVNVFENIM